MQPYEAMPGEIISIDDDTAATVEVSNLGGIDEASVTVKPGWTILSGQNATNRTSLLKSIAGALGGSVANLKSDAEKGSVMLEIGGQEFHRRYERDGNEVHVSGEPLTDAEVLIDTFVALLENNPARVAVERGEDLHEVITRPIDTDLIEQRIDELLSEKRSVEEQFKDVRKRRDDLGSLEKRRELYKSQIKSLSQELQSLRDSVEVVEAKADGATEVRDIVDRLKEHQTQLTEKHDQLEVHQAELSALQDELEDLESEPSVDIGKLEVELEEVQQTLKSKRKLQRSIDLDIDSLSTIISFNRNILAGDTESPGGIHEKQELTESLSSKERQSVDCWTCGSTVEPGTIDARLDDLQSLLDDRREESKELVDTVESLISRKQQLESEIETHRERHARLEETREEITTREERIADLRSDIDDLEGEVENLRSRAAENEELHDSDLLDIYEDISGLQYEKGQLEQQLEDVESEIEDIESLPNVKQLETERTKIAEEITNLRDRIDEIENEAVDSFNQNMKEILDVLSYDNIARIWIEKKTKVQNDNRSSQFDLHIVRESGSGTDYEDTVDNLSESERKVIGLLVGLTGYLVHEVHQIAPFILLDSVEAFDPNRLSSLLDYLEDCAPYLVVALLADDAEAVGSEHSVLSEDEL